MVRPPQAPCQVFQLQAFLPCRRGSPGTSPARRGTSSTSPAFRREMVSCFHRLADFSAYIGTWACFLRVGSVGKLDRHSMTRGETGLGHFQVRSTGLAAFVLRVADLLHPVDCFPVERFLNRSE